MEKKKIFSAVKKSTIIIAVGVTTLAIELGKQYIKDKIETIETVAGVAVGIAMEIPEIWKQELA